MGIISVGLDKIDLNADNNFEKDLLFISGFLLDVVNLKMQSTLKRYKRRINACSVASKKMVRLVFVVRW